MQMNETPSTGKFSDQLLRAWQFLVKPHPSIQEIGEQRNARLALSLILVIGALNFAGFLAATQATSLEDAMGGFGTALIGLPIAFVLAKTRFFRAGAFLFSLVFAASAYVDIIRQGNAADIAADILVFVPLSLIVASTFLSAWAVFLLVGLNIGAFLSLPFFGIVLPANSGGLAGIITTIGIVLIVLGNFRNRTESLRLEELRTVNRELEDLTGGLERRVAERTSELEAANRQTTRRASQLETITQLSESIAQFKDLNELFSEVTGLISERFGFYHVGIFLVDGDGEHAILQAANSEGGKRMLARAHRLKLGTGVVGYAAQSGQPRIALDVGADAVFFDNPDLPNTRSEVALPLKSRGETIGVLDVQSTEPGAFSTEDLQVLTALANQVSIAFENARLLTETRAALTQVQEVYNEFTRTEWSRAVSLAEQPGFRYNAGRIELLENELRTPEVASAVESGRVAANQAEASREKRGAVAVPVKLRGEVIGVLHIQSNDPDRQWLEDEVSLVEAVAERAAFAMENARLFQDARRRATKEQLISEASARIGGALNLENILMTTAEELERVLGGSEVSIRFQNKEAKE
ncbi:MAG: GAF domain-containing protein [Anaerolineales bacterium]|nr:GAF domain-containing protein [Anaerolineales bacterium]